MKYPSLILLLGASLLLSSCKTTEEAENCANTFFTHLIEENYDAAAQLLAVSPFEGRSKADALKSLMEKGEYGKLTKAEKKMGFNTEIKNGISRVSLPYELTYEEGSWNFELLLVDRGQGFRIEEIR